MAAGTTAQRLRVGAELRQLREQAGISGEHVALALGWSQPKVSRIETARTTFTIRDVAALLTFYGVSEDVRAELLALTAQDTGEGAWIVRAGGFPRRQGSLAYLETGASHIRQYQPAVVPGLLQTRDYAREIARAAGASDPEGIASARIRRQEILTSQNAPRFEVLLDARALLFLPGSPEVLMGQIRSLMRRSQDGIVLLRLIPLRVLQRAVSATPFTLYDFRAPDSPSVAFIETPTGDVYYSSPDDVVRYGDLFIQLGAAALDETTSVEYLDTLASDFEEA